MSFPGKQAQSFTAPTRFIVVQQKYAENTSNANANVTADEQSSRLASCVADITRLRNAAHGKRTDSACALEMLRRIDDARETLENILNDFLADQCAGIRVLNLEELHSFLRAEGDSYDERGYYVRATE